VSSDRFAFDILVQVFERTAPAIAPSSMHCFIEKNFFAVTTAHSERRWFVAHPRNLSVRKEIQDYLQCCQYLLSTARMPKAPRLSEDEEGIVEYYAVELLKLHPRQRTKLEYRHSVLEYIRLSEVLLKVDNLSGQEHKLMQKMLKQVVIKLVSAGSGASL
jgi:hypothetical protein